jgi:hypothetical protein
MIAILLLFIALAASAPVVGPLNYPPSFPHEAPRINQRAPQTPSRGTLGEQPRLPQPNERGYTKVISPIIEGFNWKNLIEDDEVSSYFPQYAREEDSSPVSSLSSSSNVELDPSEFLESLELGPASSSEELYTEYKYGWNKQPSLEMMEASGLKWRVEGDAKSDRLELGKELDAAQILLNMNGPN